MREGIPTMEPQIPEEGKKFEIPPETEEYRAALRELFPERGKMNPEDERRAKMLGEEARRSSGFLGGLGSGSVLKRFIIGGVLTFSAIAAAEAVAPKGAEAASSTINWGKVGTDIIKIGSEHIRGMKREEGKTEREQIKAQKEIRKDEIRAETKRAEIDARIEMQSNKSEADLEKKKMDLEVKLANARSAGERERINMELKVTQAALAQKAGKKVEVVMAGKKVADIRVVEDKGAPQAAAQETGGVKSGETGEEAVP